MNKIPQYHIVEKENEVIFYIPYDEELLNLYTKEFFELNNQNAEVAIIAFHNNDNIVGGAYMYDENIFVPYRMFYNKAKYIEDQLKSRFNNVSKNESSYYLFSNLLKNMFPEKKSELVNNKDYQDDQDDQEEQYGNMEDIIDDTDAIEPQLRENDSIEGDTLPLEEMNENEVNNTYDEIPTGNIFQITIQKKPVVHKEKQKLKIPINVILEKEIDYYNEKLYPRKTKEMYALNGIHMLI